MKRSGKIGLIAMIILMFSIVLFVGSLFWLYITGPWTGAMDKFFQPVSNNPSTNQISNYTIVQYENITFTDAIIDLQNSGINVISYNKTMDLKKARYYDYSDFKTLAIKNNLVIIIGNDGGCLLTYEEKDKILWAP